ncbi:hydroxyacid dehydrogenase [Candidatus Roizmanbacteria bacterium]|nr:hydroxyacid dehydrogenase [Candidatus Roizmanbacteria bacterium]
MSQVLIADKIDQKVLDSFKKKSFVFDYKPEITPEDLLGIISKYQGLMVRSRTKVTKEMIEAGKNLRVIGRVGSGLDNIDTDSAGKNKIKIVNAPGANANAVAEITIASILSLLRLLEKGHSSMRTGLWLKKELKGQELQGKVVGIVGYGNIGKIVKRILDAFGAKTLIFSRRKKTASLNKLFQTADIVTIHLSLNAQTEKLINKKYLSLMKPSAYLVNFSRGKVVDEKDLYNILSEKKIKGAALDVYWHEPLEDMSPWRKLDNVLLTPHIGASTGEALTLATKQVIEQIIKILSGK